jgi:hypothetical protein
MPGRRGPDRTRPQELSWLDGDRHPAECRTGRSLASVSRFRGVRVGTVDRATSAEAKRALGDRAHPNARSIEAPRAARLGSACPAHQFEYLGPVHPSGGVFDEEQDLGLAETDGVDDEDVTSDDAFEDGPHGGRCQPMPETDEFAVDAVVAPCRVLPGETHHEIVAVPGRTRPVWSSLRVHPAARRETTMPTQQRVEGDDEPGPDTPRQEPSDSGEHAPVGVGQLRSARRSPQHRYLMAKRDHFGFEHPARLRPHDQQRSDGDEQAIRQASEASRTRADHGEGRPPSYDHRRVGSWRAAQVRAPVGYTAPVPSSTRAELSCMRSSH